MQQKQKSGLGFYLAIIMIVILAFMWIRKDLLQEEEWPWQEFVNAVEQGVVTDAEIYPNKEVPTGSVRLYFNNGVKSRTWNVEDVKEAKQFLTDHDVSVVMGSVP